MLTSTVKHVSGPLQPRKSEPESLVVFNSFTRHSQGQNLASLRGERCCFAPALFSVSCPRPLLKRKHSTLESALSLSRLPGSGLKQNSQTQPTRCHFAIATPACSDSAIGSKALQAINAGGENIRVQKLAPGEFQTAEKFTHFIYEVNLADSSRPAQMSHVSWLNQDHGLLMLADLLPQSTGNFSPTVIRFDVPTGWTVASNTKSEGSQFSTDDPENAVFLIGPALHEKRQQLAGNNFLLVTSGKWPFSDKDALKIAGEIIEEYSRATRFELKSNVVLMLIPYPGEAGPESWSAETRGNDVVLLLGRKASRKKVLSRLGIVLSHELFHLWVPNSLKLDWRLRLVF